MRLVLTISFATLCACSTNDDRAAGTADATADRPVSCDSFTKAGEACTLEATMVCFRQCKIDGCVCKDSKWVCTKDFSCMPEAGPIVDGGDDDSSVEEDGGEDAALDSTADSPSDGPSDASSDASSDAPLDG